MEDAATAEISRSQVWQWLHNPHAHLEDGRPITPELFHEIVVDVLAQLKDQVGEEFFATHNYELAAKLFEEISLTAEFTDFLTITAYEYLD
jgi:malate synthase